MPLYISKYRHRVGKISISEFNAKVKETHFLSFSPKDVPIEGKISVLVLNDAIKKNVQGQV